MVEKKLMTGSMTINLLAWLDLHGKQENKSGTALAEIKKTFSEGSISKVSLAVKENKKQGRVVAEQSARRTYMVDITDAGREFLKANAAKVTYQPWLENFYGVRIEEEEIAEEPGEAPAAEVAKEVEEEEVVGKPGRLAARLERNIPGIIEESVEKAVYKIVADLAMRLGFGDVVEKDDVILEQNEKIEEMEQRMQALEEELRYTRRDLHKANEERNRALEDSDKGKRISGQGSLSAHDVQESYREIATDFLSQGGRIFRTRGKHLQWVWKDGRKTFSGSTDSDWRSVKNFRAELKRSTGYKDED